MPHAQILSALEGHPGGRILIASLEADPAAGAEISITVPGRAMWNVLSVFAELITSADVATRLPMWVLDDGQREFFRSRANSGQAASLTHQHTFSPTFGRGLTSGTVHNTPAPSPLILYPGWRIRTTTASIQAADNWAAPVVYVREIPERDPGVWDDLARAVAADIIERSQINV